MILPNLLLFLLVKAQDPLVVAQYEWHGLLVHVGPELLYHLVVAGVGAVAGMPVYGRDKGGLGPHYDVRWAGFVLDRLGAHVGKTAQRLPVGGVSALPWVYVLLDKGSFFNCAA